MTSFAANLKAFRHEARLSLNEIGIVAGCTKSHVWEMESGRASNPGLAILVRLADHFEVSLDELVGRIPRDPKPWRLCPSTHCERRGGCASPIACIVKRKRAMKHEMGAEPKA